MRGHDQCHASLASLCAGEVSEACIRVHARACVRAYTHAHARPHTDDSCCFRQAVQDLRNCSKDFENLRARPDYTLDPKWVRDVVGAENGQMLLVLPERYRRLRVARKRRCASAPLKLLQLPATGNSSAVDSEDESSPAPIRASSLDSQPLPTGQPLQSTGGRAAPEVRAAAKLEAEQIGNASTDGAVTNVHDEAVSLHGSVTDETVVHSACNRSDSVAVDSSAAAPLTMLNPTLVVTAPPTLPTAVPPAKSPLPPMEEATLTAYPTTSEKWPVFVSRLALPMAQPSRVEQQGPPSLPPAEPPTFDIESLLIASTLDGRLVAINARSGELRWDSLAGSPMLLYHRSRHRKIPHWLPSLEGELWVMVPGEVRLRKAEMSVHDFIQHAPFVTEHGLLHLGESRSSFFEVNPSTGKPHQQLGARDRRSSRSPRTKHTLRVRRVDRSVRAFALDGSASEDSWNITIATVKIGSGKRASAEELRGAFQSASPNVVMSKNGLACVDLVGTSQSELRTRWEVPMAAPVSQLYIYSSVVDDWVEVTFQDSSHLNQFEAVGGDVYVYRYRQALFTKGPPVRRVVRKELPQPMQTAEGPRSLANTPFVIDTNDSLVPLNSESVGRHWPTVSPLPPFRLNSNVPSPPLGWCDMHICSTEQRPYLTSIGRVARPPSDNNAANWEYLLQLREKDRKYHGTQPGEIGPLEGGFLSLSDGASPSPYVLTCVVPELEEPPVQWWMSLLIGTAFLILLVRLQRLSALVRRCSLLCFVCSFWACGSSCRMCHYGTSEGRGASRRNGVQRMTMARRVTRMMIRHVAAPSETRSYLITWHPC